MTYIAALRFPEFIVMSADTQESWPDEVSYEEKIDILRTPKLDITIGGAGVGDLPLGFVSHAFDEIKRLQPSTKDDIYSSLSDILVSFYEHDVKLFQSKHKNVGFVIAVRQASGELHLWRSVGMRLKEVPRYASIGPASAFVKNQLRRLWRNDLTPNQAVLLAIYIISAASKGSRVIGGDGPTVAYINKLGVTTESDDYTKIVKDRFSELQQYIDTLLLAMPDLTIIEPSFLRMLNEVRDKVTELRAEYKKRFAEQSVREGINWAYPKLPLGSTMIETSTFFVYSDPDDPSRETRALRLDDDGVLRFKMTTNVYLDEKTYEHLRECQSANLRECIQHIGQDY